MVDRVFQGEIREGFRRYRLRETERGVEIEKKKRMHRFGSGYEDRGPWLGLTMTLSEKEARAVRDLLDDWLSEGETLDGGDSK